MRIASKKIYEAKELLDELESWSENDLAALPPLYQEKAERYQQLANHGE